MNNWNNRYVASVGFFLGSTAMMGALTTTGCSSEKPFARINGVPVSQSAYIHALERQSVAIPNGQTTNAERLVIDQLIGNQVILAEAAKIAAVPSDEEVTHYYDTQKKIFENQYPGKSYETSMKEQGTTPEDVKSDMKVQLAEANLYAKKLNIDAKEIRDTFEKAKGNVGLPARVQLRLILVAPNSPDMARAQQLITGKTPFEEVGKQVNPPQLRPTGGLLPQATPIANLSVLIGPEYQNKVQQSPEGTVFGPIDFRLSPNQLPAKAWVKLEKKLPALSIPFDDAVPLIKKQLVAMKLADPTNQKVRNEVVNAKLAAKFEPTEPSYTVVWDALKKGAEDSGVGRDASASGAAPASSVPVGTTPAVGTAGKTP